MKRFRRLSKKIRELNLRIDVKKDSNVLRYKVFYAFTQFSKFRNLIITSECIVQISINIRDLITQCSKNIE